MPKNTAIALGVALLIGFSGCDKESAIPPENIPPSRSEIIEKMRMRAMKACDPQNITAIEMSWYTSDFEKWLNTCDSVVQEIIRNSNNYRARQPKEYSAENTRHNVTRPEFELLTFATHEATEMFQALSELDPETQYFIQMLPIWKPKLERGLYADFEYLHKVIEIYKILEGSSPEKRKELEARLTGKPRTIFIEQLPAYGFPPRDKTFKKQSAQIRIPTMSEILSGSADLQVALGALRDYE